MSTKKKQFYKEPSENVLDVIFKIEDDIPIPVTTKRGKYPFQTMAVGQSFSFPVGSINKVRNAAYGYGKKGTAKFVVRVDPEDTEMARCWRRE